MAKYSDSLRGYGFEIHQRDGFKCQYCGADGTESFETWLTLSVDHLLPPNHTDREKDEYKVTACRFCNEAANRYFEQAEKLNLKFDGLKRDALVLQRLPYVLETRQRYREFWLQNVMPNAK